MKVTADGFVWLIPNPFQIEKAFGVFDLYILHDDDSESLISTEEELAEAIGNFETIGIEVGHLK